jgi:hypothetical protein
MPYNVLMSQGERKAFQNLTPEREMLSGFTLSSESLSIDLSLFGESV